MLLLQGCVGLRTHRRPLCLQRWVLNNSLGYFTYDTLCCLVIDWDFANVVHHLCTMLGLAVGVCNGVVCCSEWLYIISPRMHVVTQVVTLMQSGAELTFCLLLMEVSNPFLHSRFLMKVSITSLLANSTICTQTPSQGLVLRQTSAP